MKKTLALALAILAALTFTGCDSLVPSATPSPTVSAAPTVAPTQAPTVEPTVEPTVAPTETPSGEPTTTTEATEAAAEVDSAGSGSLVFDIYQSEASRDINADGTAEAISFTSGAAKSVLTIDGTDYEVAKANLAQRFAITDIDINDKYMEFVFTDAYNSDLADSEKAFSWFYWWDGSKLLLMGGLMDVKFDGAWRSSFKVNDVIDGKGQVFGLARTQELTDIWYTAYYKTTGSSRKLYEWRHTAEPINEVGPLTCKTVCLIQINHDEISRDVNKYMSSDYDHYWNPALTPTAIGRDIGPEEGIKVIVRPGEKLTIVGTYGPTWFKVKTEDNLTGWIFCQDGKVGGYYTVMGWMASDMFNGLVVAG